MGAAQTDNQTQSYFLSDLLGEKVLLNGKKIGKLSDLIAKENGTVPVITHIFVQRSFGYPSLVIPWENVVFSEKSISVNIEGFEKYEVEPDEHAILLKDYIVDKKVLDVTDKDVEVVYDIKLIMKHDRLYVSDVDFSRHRLFSRLKIGALANMVYKPDELKKHEVSWLYIQPLETISSFRGDIHLKVLKEKLSELQPMEVADVLEQLEHPQRVTIFDELETHRASDVLEEFSPNVQRTLISSMKEEKVAELLDLMTSGQAADVLAVLPVPKKDSIIDELGKIDRVHTEKIVSILNQFDQPILNYSTRDFIAVGPEETLNEVQEKYYLLARGKKVVMYIYVVDDQGRLRGVVDIRELLDASPNSKMTDIMIRNIITLRPESTLKEASLLFSRYTFRAIPIVDADSKLVGIVPYRDVMDLKHILID